MKNSFVHLHVHTEYSLLDGLSNIKKLIQRVKEYNMNSVGLTDHGVMYGAIEFYKACLQEDVKPVIGIEAYVMKGNDSHTEKDAKKKTNANHLILLAKNKQGYKNLMELTSIAHLEGFYYKPRFDKATLRKYSEGLICTSACGSGEIARALVNDSYEVAKEKVGWYLDVFGNDYYLELQRHEYVQCLKGVSDTVIRSDLERLLKAEEIIVEGKVKLSRELGVPLIATNDVHYIDVQDAPAQDALVCIATGNTVNQVKRMRYIDTPTFYFRSSEEMASLFPEYGEALRNTVAIAEKCDLELTLGQWFFPKLPDLPEGKTEEEILREEVYNRLDERMGKVTDEIKKRIEFELDIICKKGYAGYFLINDDFAEWARQEGIVTNTRGSAAGSLVSYVLGITTVDPLRYYLPFERFLNPFRPSPPDIDFDIADNRRLDLIQYIVSRFGQDKVAQICTFGRMLAKGAVRDIARVLGYPYSLGDSVSKLIPLGSQGFPMTIERALKESPELREMYDQNVDAKKIIDLAKGVEGSARHCSVHAAGVVVAPTKITDFTPLQREAKGDKVITQYEFHNCEDVGLIKFDILGITFLTILDTAVNLVEKTTGNRIDLRKIPVDDEKTFEMLAKGDTVGVFQMVSSGMTKWLVEMKPNKVEDLMAMVALYRPGPMANIQDYIDRKQGKSPVIYFHEKVKKFLEASYGILVYQDDLLYTAIELAGYDWKEVDKFRKAVGKKIPKEMAKQHVKFVEGCIKHSNMIKAEAEDVWKLFEPFQGYGFNKAHAASYGMISYYTAYMKANYPVEYMTAMMTADSGDVAKVAMGVEAARKMDILVLPPDINESEIVFTVVKDERSLGGQAIRFGLSAIKNVGAAAVEAILKARTGVSELGESSAKTVNRPFVSLTDFFTRVDTRKVNKKVLESLIKAGAFDRFGERASVLASIEGLRQQVEQLKKKKASGQVDLFASTESVEAVGQTGHDSKDKLLEVPSFTKDQKLKFEKELLGFYLTENPLASKLAGFQLAISHKIGDLTIDDKDQQVKVGGMIASVRVVTTKRSNKQMAFGCLTDESGSIDLVIFPNTFIESRDYWKEGEVLLIEGKVEYREDSLSLIVDQVISVDSPQVEEISSTNKEHVLVIPKGLDRNKLVALNGLLKNNPGEDSLTLVFENGVNGGKRVLIPFGVDYSKKVRREVVELLKKEE